MCKVQFKAYFAATFVVLLGTVGTFLPRANAQATSQPAALSGGSDAASSGTAGAGQANPFTADWLVGYAVSDANSPQYKDVAEAITRFRNNDVAGARELLLRARQSNPKLPPVELMIGRLWMTAGQANGARSEWEKAVVAYPNDPEAFLYFAEASIVEHRITDAEAILQKVKPLIDAYSDNLKRKRNFEIRYNSAMAAVNEARNQWEAAIPFFKAWLDLDSENVAAHQRLGRTLFQLGKPTDAYNEFDAALKSDPKSLNPYIALADLYEQAKDRPNAAKSIGYAVQKNPKDLSVQLQAAKWAMVTNQLSEAQKYADKALQIDPKSLEAKILRGEIARFTGDMKTAETNLEQAVTQAPANIEASNQLALVLVEQDDKDKKDRALQIAELNLRATTQGDRANPEILATYAWVLYKLGRTNEAEQILSKVMGGGQISPDTAYYVGKMLQDRGKTSDAIKILESAVGSPNPFAQRQASTELLAQLRKQMDQNTGAGKAGDTPAGSSK
jgi:tetratricopeptide (TPR) repeat protein